ncbi:Phospholysine phosphohistidine inorganic pyrophosphate phosphatase [Paramuricea clavata]|uniref:Phospholysine phosphohistidine inorganic pyrophosphate phosphatase n=1 Tax=Paramuricea clavata TaxID=317549 RepID=A0A6S7HHS3_PARCT|nr:Phospholysine phosphohistidine inorganic pyrophosphate phosphatase [Paramuricea clavata]
MLQSKPGWLQKAVKGVLLDITGVLYNSGQGLGQAIPGSINAVERLKSSGIPVKFCTNETQCTREKLVSKLNKLGFSLTLNEVHSPAPLAVAYIKEHKLRPYLLVHTEALGDYADVEKSESNCVVVGDAAEEFNYENMNRAFRVLLESDNPIILALGTGRYYKDSGELVLDNGPFIKALEYACDVKTVVLGKPATSYFDGAVKKLGVPAENVIMIGDDLIGDVGGAQSCGIRGVQVKTGKYRLQDEQHETIKADGRVKDLAEAAELILQFNTVTT